MNDAELKLAQRALVGSSDIMDDTEVNIANVENLPCRIENTTSRSNIIII